MNLIYIVIDKRDKDIWFSCDTKERANEFVRNCGAPKWMTIHERWLIEGK